MGHDDTDPNAGCTDYANDGKDFEYDSGHEFKCKVDEAQRRWTVEVRVPLPLRLATKTGPVPKVGDKWRINLFRYDTHQHAYLAWSPTLKNPAAFHVPDKFGTLEFTK